MNKAQKIVKLHEEGKTISEIAKELGLKYQHVYNTIVIKGLEPNLSRTGKREEIEKLLREGKTAMQIALELKINPNYVYKVRKEMK